MGPAPEGISLLAAVQACQGRLAPDTCVDVPYIGGACAFHAAMYDLHQAMVGSLSRWTLKDLLAKPRPEEGSLLGHCKIQVHPMTAQEGLSSRRGLAKKAA